MSTYGYERDRFPNLPSDSFECIICSEVVRDPWQCHQCGKMFCKFCINDWINKNPAAKCPNRCPSPKIAQVTSKALLKLYNQLDIKCSNQKCLKLVKLIDLNRHQQMCTKVKCWNFVNCQKIQNQTIKAKKPSCSIICTTLLQLTQNFGNMKKMYEILQTVCKSQIVIGGNFNNFNNSLKNISMHNIPLMNMNPGDLCWDSLKVGLGMIFTQSNHHIFLKQQAYVFRSAIGNIGFTSGVNYWQIIADNKTQNQLKIGVTTSRDFDLNSAFCDIQSGFAYYGLGQLRHGSNATGPAYGKRFKKDGVLGCCLNMDKGTLSFALNGEYWGVAYTDPKLKIGPIYPAVSLLHCAGCKIRGGIKVPSYFKQ